ncbi:MAG: peptidylprolyl isomerase [Blastocatellia bacterium]
MKVYYLISFLLCATVTAFPVAAQGRKNAPRADLHLPRILQCEDERNLADDLLALLKDPASAVRERAALAVGRIGDKRGTDALIAVLEHDESGPVRAMAAFALGEMEDVKAVAPLMALLEAGKRPLAERARPVEALGKIAGVEANATALGADAVEKINQRLVEQLPDTAEALTPEKRLLVSLTITALMRVRSAASVEPLGKQLKSADPEIRAQAANALARLRRPIESAVPALLESLSDENVDVRANAVRALGASKDARAIEPVVKLLDDQSEQVRANAIRAAAALDAKRFVQPLLAAGDKLYKQSLSSDQALPEQLSLLYEIATALAATRDSRALPLLRQFRALPLARHKTWPRTPPVPLFEFESAMARFGEREFFDAQHHVQGVATGLPQPDAATIRGWGEAGGRLAQERLLKFVNKKYPDLGDEAWTRLMPEALRALAKTKHEEAPQILRAQLAAREVILRATAAALLADRQSDETLAALVEALKHSKGDADNDAKLAILDAIAKYKRDVATEAVKSALDDRDHLVRRHAVTLLKQMDAGDFSARIGTVQTGHDAAFYGRVAGRLDKTVTATIRTDKGDIRLDLFPRDAPLTVESFVSLARKGYFNNLSFHRVVPNFVVQGGDPRGDGEGGPGYQIRCEINTRPYVRGALGMALSGKDTGGSQFFITHSAQPHLDGGYTVFGQVTAGMEVVNRIARGDVIRKVEITDR